MAVVQLGGHPVTFRADEVGLDARETLEDVARTLAGYHAAHRRPGLRARELERDGRGRDVPGRSTCCPTDAHPLPGARRPAHDPPGASARSTGSPSPGSATATTSPARWRRRGHGRRCELRFGLPAGLRPRDADLDRSARSARPTCRHDRPPRPSMARTSSTPTCGRRWARRTRPRRAGAPSRASPSTTP